MTNLWLHGASGKMGLEIQSAIQKRTAAISLIGGSGRKFMGDNLLAGRPVDSKKLAHALAHSVDVVIDFSVPEGNEILLDAMEATPADKRPQVLIGTTGISEKNLGRWSKVATTLKGGCIFLAPNTSRGVLAAIEGALRIQEILRDSPTDVAIVETHHIMKKDAPSGTARMFLEKLSEHRTPPATTISVSSIRGGGVFGEHQVRFMGVHDEIIVTHRAYSRGLFAEGALDLAAWQHKNGSRFKEKLITLSDYVAAKS